MTAMLVVSTDAVWPAVSSGSLIEHSTQRWAIYVSDMDREADNAQSVLIHHHHYPVALQQDRFAAKEFHAPQTVLGVAD